MKKLQLSIPKILTYSLIKGKIMEETNKSKSALLIIDVQKGLFNQSGPIYNAEILLQNINLLVSKAKTHQIPIIYIQHSNDSILVYGSDAWQFHPAISPTENDYLIHKKHGNAFEETSLREILQSKSVNTLVITGLVTHGCVKATILGAIDLGYSVILVEDGHSNYSKDAPHLIDKWNQKLSKSGVKILKTNEIDFHT
jgi:nicotinamidase-related amidase